MSLIHFKPEEARTGPTGSKEKVFLEHYDWLLQSALSLTRGQKERAEDLVHDAFVQFQIKIKNLDEVEDLRGYLYGMLRNLYLSQLRSTTRHPIQPLSILDHDSAFVGLRAHDFSDQLHATKLLTVACEFVSYRKESTLTASIFILRYFHCYYPDEIAVLLAAQRENVDRWLSRGRAEAKVFLTAPYPIPKTTAKAEPSGGSQLFLVQLRGIIFASCATPCPLNGKKQPDFFFGTQELAHLVSCPACLGKRSKQVGLPGLSERVFEEPHQRDDRGGPSAGAGGTGSSLSSPKKARANKLRKGYARTRELLKHYPAELSIAVDGHIRTTHVISSSVSLLNLAVDAKERVEFVEILSEQGVRFLLLDRNDLETLAERRYDIALSDGRLLEIEIVPDAQGPCIQVAYRDPGLKQTSREAVDTTPNLLAHNTRLTLLAALRTWFGGLPVPLRLFAALTLSICLLTALPLLFWHRQEPNPQFAELLQKAIKQEQALPPNAAAHSVFRYEEDDETFGVVDTWRQSVPHHQALRYYDAQHALVRGFLQEVQGNVEYGSHAKDDAAKAPRGWHDVPSPEHFVSLLSPGLAPEVIQSASQYTLVAHSPHSAPEWLNVALVIDRQSMRAVEADYDIREGQSVHHVRLREVSYEVHPADGFDRGVFDVARDFEPSARRSHAAPEKLMDDGSTAARLELQVLSALMQAGTGPGEQLDVHRNRQTGIVEVAGVADTPTRKNALSHALASLAGDPSLKIALRSSDEVPQLPVTRHAKGSKQPDSPALALETFQAVSSSIPADASIRAHFKAQGLSGQPLEDSIRQFAKEACTQSLVAQQRAYRLAQLAAEFTPDDLAQLDSASRLQWLVLVSNYSEAINGVLSSLRNHLHPVLGSATLSTAEPVAKSLSPLTNPMELAVASRDILSQAARLNQRVQSAFSISAVSPDSPSDLQPAADGEFAEIAHLLDAAQWMAGNLANTAQHLQLFAANTK
jgi:RNA polymerase sigma factor (sigma-70 family)